MNQRKSPPGGPKVEVIRKPGGPVAPRPVTASAPPFPKPAAGPPARGGPPPRRFGPRPNRPPPTAEQVAALANPDRVPARIAKGDLEGKMRTHIWRKLHAEEAKRFTQAYDLMEKMPNLSLADAFGVIQSGRPAEEFLARKARGQMKVAIKEARGKVSNEPVQGFIHSLVQDKVECAVALGERTLLDVVTAEGPASFTLERTGRVEKLHVVLITRRAYWDKISNGLERDPKLAKKPAGVPREPEKRPVADPRPFLDAIGKAIRLDLRNGITLSDTLTAVGPFDLILGEGAEQVFVPLHALLRWA